jgi:arginyl-tRNA synthetase
MSSLTTVLTDLVADAFVSAGYEPRYGRVAESNRPDLAQFQCNGALEAAKRAGRKPRDVAEEVVSALRGSEAASAMLARIGIAGPGFINLDVNDASLAAHVSSMRDEHLGCEPVTDPVSLLVDYGGANVAKPMHVGHLRSSIIGESLKRIARFMGHNVTSDVHLGDWGLQMGMLIAELARRSPELPYFDAARESGYPSESPVTIEDLQELYPEASRRAKSSDEAMAAARAATMELQSGRPGYLALWRHLVAVSIAELKPDFEALGVSFDEWLGESDVAEAIPGLIDRLKRDGFAEQSDGAWIIDVAEPDDKKSPPPLIVAKSDGSALYGTTDLATIEQRLAKGVEQILYVVDNRQADHFLQVFRAARKAGVAPADVGLEHIGFGTMNGTDGKPFKTREGGVMRLKDLIEIITAKARERMAEAKVALDFSADEVESIARDVGLAALKYADLMNHRARDYVFDLDRFSAFEGKTGPYLLYTAVRIKAIQRKAVERGLEPGELIAPEDDLERAVMIALARFPDVVSATFEHRAPNHLAEYAYQLATVFNRFYAEHHILRESDPARQASWLGLAEQTARVLEKTLDLLGLRVPERM